MRPSRPKLGRLRALGRYYRDPSASIFGKLIALAALIYVVVPIDLIPDVPVVGWLDDLGVMGLATLWLGRVASRYRTPGASPEGSSSESERRPSPVGP